MSKKPEIENAILEILQDHVGFDDRIRRLELLAALRYKLEYRIGDRLMRRSIESLRNTVRGCNIVATNESRGGYFIAADPDELSRFLAADHAHAINILSRISFQETAFKYVAAFDKNDPVIEIKISSVNLVTDQIKKISDSFSDLPLFAESENE